MNKDRIVVTGMGVISPVGEGIKEFWNAITEGRSGVDDVKHFDTSLFKHHKNAEVKNFVPEKYMDKEKIKSIGRASQFGIAAVKMALDAAGLDITLLDKERVGVSIGTTMGEIQVEETISETWVNEGPDNISASIFGQYPCDSIPAHIADEFLFSGPNIMIPTACAAGNYAFGHAYELLRQNKADVMIAGGIDPFSRVAFTGFHRLLSMAPECCQPFDKNRKGIIVGEGAGILVMERLHDALKRGAPVLAEMLGYGLGCDAHHMTAPHPEGMGGITAIKRALDCGRVSVEKIDYISAHGTGTRENDRAETMIVKSVFNSHAYTTPVSSIKSMLGHTMGAASAIEAVLCVLVVNNDIIPPTINYTEPDPECDLDYVPNESRDHKVNIALSNAFAFGGNNASILISKFKNKG